MEVARTPAPEVRSEGLLLTRFRDIRAGSDASTVQVTIHGSVLSTTAPDAGDVIVKAIARLSIEAKAAKGESDPSWRRILINCCWRLSRWVGAGYGS